MADRTPLTFAALLPALAAGDDEATVALLRGRSERERRAVGPELSAAYRDWEGFRELVPGQYLDTAAAAVLGTASLGELRRLDDLHRWGVYCSEAAHEVLRDRRPPWLDRWVDHALRVQARKTGRADSAWSFVRLLIREGLCPTPTDDAYILDMVDGIAELPFDQRSRWYTHDSDHPGEDPDGRRRKAYRRRRQERSVLTVLRDEPELCEHEVWRLFEVPGRPSRMLSPTRETIGDEIWWAEALTELAGSGTIGRRRLLTGCLAAMSRAFPRAQVRWCILLHDRLEVTESERRRHQSDYLHLLGAHEPAAMRCGVDNLAALADEGSLDDRAYLVEAEPVVLTAPATTAIPAMRLVGRLLRGDSSLVRDGSATIAAGLCSGSVRVQKAALRIIEQTFSPSTAAELSPVIDECIELVDGSLRPRLASLLLREPG